MTGDNRFAAELAEGYSEVLKESNTLTMTGILFDNAVRMLKEHGCEHRNEIIAAIDWAFEKYVVPYDIPGVGPISEAALERVAARLLHDNCVWAANQFCGPVGGVAPTDGGEDEPPTAPE